MFKNTFTAGFLFPILTLLFWSCVAEDSQYLSIDPDAAPVNITVIYTGDEHGWMSADEGHGGAAVLHRKWRDEYGLDSNANVLLLSGGDMWTGPAISTWFAGESMLATMNMMGYDAAAIGNHEFDFGLEALNTRREQSDFPFLAANLRNISDNNIPEFANPYTILEVSDDIRIGVIGLSSLSTPYTTHPDNVSGFQFVNYESALTEIMPELNLHDVDFKFIIGHLCQNEMIDLREYAATQNVILIGGGHCHELSADVTDGIAILSGGSEFRQFAWAEIVYDPVNDQLMDLSSGTASNNYSIGSAVIDSVVTHWEAEMDGSLALEIGFARNTIREGSPELANLITDSWLISFPDAQIALTNYGGIRQDIPSGNITLETIVGVLPFQNTIYQMELPGSAVMSVANGMAMGGINNWNGLQFMEGLPLHPDSTYIVLTNSYLYSVTDVFQTADPNAYDTSVQYRQPAIEWIQSLETSTEDPLNNYLDTISRH